MKHIVMPIVTLVSFYILLKTSNCYADTPKSQNIKIGVIQSMTGIAAEEGKTVVQALQLASEEINAQGLKESF